jgi:hypothetical protein
MLGGPRPGCYLTPVLLNCTSNFKRADIAQWLERLFCKQRVVGSNPSVGSITLISRDSEAVKHG